MFFVRVPFQGALHEPWKGSLAEKVVRESGLSNFLGCLGHVGGCHAKCATMGTYYGSWTSPWSGVWSVKEPHALSSPTLTWVPFKREFHGPWCSSRPVNPTFKMRSSLFKFHLSEAILVICPNSKLFWDVKWLYYHSRLAPMSFMVLHAWLKHLGSILSSKSTL